MGNTGFEIGKKTKVITGLQPVDTTGSASNGDFVSMKNAANIAVILNFGVAAVGTPAITLSQAKDVAGTDVKSLAFDKALVNADTAASDAFVLTDVVSDSLTKAAGSNQQIVINIRASTLDVENGFDTLRVNISTPGANATLISVIYEATHLRYAADIPNTMITD